MPRDLTLLFPTNRRFSPYLDPDPIIDFFDDDAQRLTSIFGIAVFVHLGLLFLLSTNFIVPDLLPDEPDVVPVQIVTFDPTPPEEEAPAPEVIDPVIPPPAVAPRRKPTPKPTPPPPPAPMPVPIPEPEPETIRDPTPPPPPPPEILSEPTPEPEPDTPTIPEPLDIPPPLEPIVEPAPIPEPEPQPVIEFFDPLPEPEPEPIIEIFEPPVLEPEPLPELEPIVPNLPLIDALPTPGVVIETQPLEPIQPELPPLPEPAPLPDPIPVPPPPTIIQPPQIEAPPEPDIITTAPSILASPDAPVTPSEVERAVPQGQSDPFFDLLKRERALTPTTPGARNPTIAGPSAGGGNISAPPSGGTRLGQPGTGGWTLAPGSYGNSPGEGYERLNMDIRCREAGKTHLDCPEYLKKFQGRNGAGFQSFKGQEGRGTDRGPQVSTTIIPGQQQLNLRIGDNSVNGGGPSTTIMDDGPEVIFDREFRSKPVVIQERQRGLLDLLTPPEVDDTDWDIKTLPQPDE